MMRLLLFSDLHCDVGVARQLVARWQSVDVVVGAGDFGNLRSGLERSPGVLHGSGVEIGGLPLFGLGGGMPVTLFGSWNYDSTEEQAGGLLKVCPGSAVLVSHSPPCGAADASSRGQSLGSTAVSDTITRLAPRLVVCSHIHGSAGQTAWIGKTPVDNAGPNGVLWELP